MTSQAFEARPFLPRVVTVEGHEFPDPDASRLPEGEFPPFYVHDSVAQRHVAGPFPTRDAAELGLAEYLAGPFPDFCHVIRPATVSVGNGRAGLWVTIEFKGGKLSLTGVEGPRGNGDCAGSCGQTGIDESAVPAEGYTAAELTRLRDVWERWHLNDMRPYSPEMAALGWDREARVACWRHEFSMTRESSSAKKAAEEAALRALRAGAAFKPSAEQAHAAALPYSCDVWAFTDQPQEPPAGYERARDFSGNVKAPERKTLGWVKPSEFGPGLLGRKVRESDSHGYGGKWWTEEVPRDVLEWLVSLPLPPEGRALPAAWRRA